MSRAINHGQPPLWLSPAGRPLKAAGLWKVLLSDAARPLRFAGVGGACGILQLAMLIVLKQAGMHPIPANIGAYVLSAQVNFLLSNRFIWHDRWSPEASGRDLLQRWLAFHVSIAGTFLLSQAVFIAARLSLPDVVASAVGIGVSAVANFVVQDRLTFQALRGHGDLTFASRRNCGRSRALIAPVRPADRWPDTAATIQRTN